VILGREVEAANSRLNRIKVRFRLSGFLKNLPRAQRMESVLGDGYPLLAFGDRCL
jgi:hypothetical protein